MKDYCFVERNGTRKPVKNLGWLLRNWQDVSSFTVRTAVPEKMIDCILIANLKCGGRYETPYASKEVLSGWLNRPIFKGLAVDWFGAPGIIGKDALA